MAAWVGGTAGAHAGTRETGEPVACGSFLPEWVRGSLGTSIQDPRGSTHGGVALNKNAAQRLHSL